MKQRPERQGRQRSVVDRSDPDDPSTTYCADATSTPPRTKTWSNVLVLPE
ncbi:MAG: hypothetical protein GY898_05240 [Proteobacteria bacterium]|nr:hypothetical protein [Pseudomonadota bacterium]